MFRKKKTARSSFAVGALLGGVLGGAAALLFAPKSGEKMREELADRYHRVTEESLELMDSVCNHSMDMIERAKEIAEEAKKAATKYLEQKGRE